MKRKFILIAGPCVIESKAVTYRIAAALKEIVAPYPVEFVFKSSFYKANRTSLRSFRGPGLVRGLKIIDEIKRKLNVKVLSDVHCCNDIKAAAGVLDIIQIPAFLSRQTDLIISAAKTRKIINIKKAQFMSPDDLGYVIEKVTATGNRRILLTERGSCFGYNNLVVDFRSFSIMKKFGYPVIFDVTHSLQRPSAAKGSSGGDRKFVEPLALAGVAAGVDGIFMEVHPQPHQALSDKTTSFALSHLTQLLKKIMRVRRALYAKD